MQAPDLTALLLPIAAASGWFAAKKNFTRQSLKHFAHPLADAYRRSLHYLLDENTDKAIAAITHILERDSEPLETHIALGNLYRRRGEVEKAIQIHEKLLQEPGRTESQRQRATYELGIDYLRAGLLDRAEAMFLALVRDTLFGRVAMQQLLQIYQRQKDWRKAIECTLKLRHKGRLRHGETVAHFLCELADEAMVQSRLAEAHVLLDQALEDDPACVRASLTKGRLELGQGEYRQALATLQRVERQNPIYLPATLPLVKACWEHLDNEPDFLEYLEHLHRDFGIMAAAAERAEHIRRRQDLHSAMDYLLPIMESKPDPLAISRALALLTEDSGLGASRMQRLCRLLQELLSSTLHFRCEQCGFAVTELYWHCPSCQYWGSIRPVGACAVAVVAEIPQQPGK